MAIGRVLRAASGLAAGTARAEGEALSQSRRRFPRSGVSRSAAPAGVQLPPLVSPARPGIFARSRRGRADQVGRPAKKYPAG